MDAGQRWKDELRKPVRGVSFTVVGGSEEKVEV